MIALPSKAAAFIACLVFSWSSHAGTSCEKKKIGPDELYKAMTLGQKTRDVVERVDAQVALVGRIGSNLSEHGLRYSHMGALVRDHPKGKWTFVHVLNHCGAPTSAIYNEGLANFFLDDPYEYEAVVIVPSADLQQRLLDALLGPSAMEMHNPTYNMIAHPRSQLYQNSNQWLVELIAVAHAEPGTIATRAQAQEHLARNGYTADPIRIPAMKRLGARLFRANVKLEEHEEKGSYGVYETITVRSVARFLDRIDSAQAKRVIRLDREERAAERF